MNIDTLKARMKRSPKRNMSISRLTPLPDNILNAEKEYLTLVKQDILCGRETIIDLDALCAKHGVITKYDKQWLADDLIAINDLTIDLLELSAIP